MRGILFDCCASATSGAARMPVTVAMKARRPITEALSRVLVGAATSLCGRESQRQRERERRALAHLTLYPDPPPVQLDELASFVITPPLHRHELMVGTLGDVVPRPHQRLELREGRVHLPGHERFLRLLADD